MKVAFLKQMLADMPDDCEVVVDGSDHTYIKVRRASKVQAELSRNKILMWEYFDEASRSQSGSKIVDVLVIS